MLLVVAASCATAPRPSSVPPAPITSASFSRTPSTASEPPLIVAGQSGLFQLDANGANARRLGTSTHARAPRFVPGKNAVVFLRGDAQLVELNLATGSERVIAGPWLPGLLCPAAAGIPLTLQSEEDVELDADGRHVCVSLSDRNLNMASFRLSVRADLATGEAEVEFPLGCEASTQTPPLVCHAASTLEPEQAKAFAVEFHEPSRTLRDVSNRTLVKLEEWNVDVRSPGGRWIVLRGNVAGGDYVHMNYLLVDRRTGAVFPVPERNDAEVPSWPMPLTATELADPSRARLGSRAGDYVGEDSLHFVGPARLVVGTLLFLLEQQRVVGLAGDLAR